MQAGVLEGAILRRIERDEGGKEATMARYVHGGQLTLETGVRDRRAIVILGGVNENTPLFSNADPNVPISSAFTDQDLPEKLADFQR